MIMQKINKARNEVIRTIIYILDWYESEEDTIFIKNIFFSYNNKDWYIVLGGLSCKLVSFGKNNLTSITADYIQRSLNNSYWRPYEAVNYLHKAKRDKGVKHKWINTTIAAELAIKEFLIDQKPDLKIFILKVPSPPLDKLYGEILECYFGEKSPKVKPIKHGIEIRNKLVHSPDTVNISLDEAEKYINDVEIAIFHLVSLVYGKDDYIVKKYL